MSGSVWDEVNYKLSSLSGDVFVKRGSQTLKLESEMELFESDVVLVAANAIAQLQLSDSSLLRLGQNSELELGVFSVTPFVKTANVSLKSGSVWVNTDFVSLRPVKVKLDTPYFDFDIFKSSKIAVKVNANSLSTYNYQKPVAYSYQDKRFILNKSSKAVLNQNLQTDIFSDNMLAFMKVNQSLDSALVTPAQFDNSHIAGVLPGEIMYSFDVIDDWFETVVVVDREKRIDNQIANVSEKLAEVDLLAKSSTSLTSIRKELKKVVDVVNTESENVDSDVKETFIEKISAVENSLDKNTAPEVYFELKTMISNAKLDVSSSEERSSVALDSANELLSDISNADVETQQRILPKVIDQVNYVLSGIVSQSGYATAAALQTKDLQSVLEDTLVISQTLDQNLVADKLVTEKVNELKENLEDLAQTADLDPLEVELIDSYIEFDSDQQTQVETSDFVAPEIVDLESTKDLNLDQVEQPENLELEPELPEGMVVESESESESESEGELIEASVKEPLVQEAVGELGSETVEVDLFWDESADLDTMESVEEFEVLEDVKVFESQNSESLLDSESVDVNIEESEIEFK